MARDKNHILCCTDGFSFFGLSAENEKYSFFSLRSLRLKRACERAVIFIFLLLLPISTTAQANDASLPFRSIAIEAQFYDVLIQRQGFMKEGGAKIFAMNDGSKVLIGIGKAFPEDSESETVQQARRKAEIRARATILSLGGDIEIATYKGLKTETYPASEAGKMISLSSFFQVTETQVAGEIQQLPVVGTWSSPDSSTFYVAVGKISVATASRYVGRLKRSGADIKPGGVHNITGGPAMQGSEPFVSLVQASPLLRQNGGVRGFILDGDRKVLIAVASAPINGSYAKARRVAQLKAIRSLLGHREGIKLSAVEYLEDQEHLQITANSEEWILLSQFLSVRKEQVSGIIKSLPVVASWNSSDGRIIYVAIGGNFEQ